MLQCRSDHWGDLIRGCCPCSRPVAAGAARVEDQASLAILVVGLSVQAVEEVVLEGGLGWAGA